MPSSQVFFCSLPVATRFTASKEVFSRNPNIRRFTLGMDTNAICHGLSCPECLSNDEMEAGEKRNLHYSRTQQDPQAPWSLSSLRDGQLPHFSRGSKLSGSSRVSRSIRYCGSLGLDRGNRTPIIFLTTFSEIWRK